MRCVNKDACATSTEAAGNRISTPSNAVAPEKILTKDEIYRLIDACPRRIGIIIEFLYSTGVRISEALNIQYADMEESSDHWNIRILGKGNKERIYNC